MRVYHPQKQRTPVGPFSATRDKILPNRYNDMWRSSRTLHHNKDLFNVKRIVLQNLLTKI